MIQSAASAASAKGGCASSRLDHGLKFFVIRGGCASSQLISEFSDCVQSNLIEKADSIAFQVFHTNFGLSAHAGSQLDHGLENPPAIALAADLVMAVDVCPSCRV